MPSSVWLTLLCLCRRGASSGSLSEDVRLATDWYDQRPRSGRIAALQAQLKRMADEDQSVRTAVPVSEARMREVDRANLPQLLQIHRNFGWPKRSVVGKEAAGRFWLLVQHQDRPATQTSAGNAAGRCRG